jgi:hypothetical protein
LGCIHVASHLFNRELLSEVSMSKNILATAIFCLLPSLVFAQNDLSKTPPTSFTTITPIFSQLLMLPSPKGFEPAFTEAKENSYISESVLAGETVKNGRK